MTRILGGHNFDPGWHATAQACRWGVVILCLVLVPGVAFIGQGIGRWLRTQSASRWRTPLELLPAAPVTPVTRIDEEPTPLTVAELGPSISPDESAAMYAGGRHLRPSHATSTGSDSVVPVSHDAPVATDDKAFQRFAELEQVLRDRGALSYALESDRQSRYAYRFHCVMPPEQAGGPERVVEASGATALEAIQRVVRQLNSPASLR